MQAESDLLSEGEFVQKLVEKNLLETTNASYIVLGNERILCFGVLLNALPTLATLVRDIILNMYFSLANWLLYTRKNLTNCSK